MRRRELLMGGLAAGLAAGIGPVPAGSQSGERYLALEWFRCRRDIDVTRMRSFFGEALVPGYNRAGVRPVGVFQTTVGPDNPSFLVVSAYAAIDGVADLHRKLGSDALWGQHLKAFEEKWELAYERRESSLLRGFRTFPGIELPKVEEGKSNLFELRVYESRNSSGHERKVAMFDDGEIEVFRRVGIHPVFFGSTLFGTRMPNLTYMVYYPSWEARAEAWTKFSQDPQWKKMSAAPGSSDRELVSSISNQLMTALAASQIR